MQKKSFVVVLIFAAFVVAAFFIKSQPDNVPAGVTQYRVKTMEKSPEPVVQISVTESRKFLADDFVIRLHLDLRQENKEVLMKNLTEQRMKLFSVVEKLNVPETNVEQSSVELNKMWNYSSDKKRLRGYRATQDFKVRLDSRSAVDELEKLVLQIPDMEIRGIAAGLKNPEQLQKNVAKVACEKAYGKALEYAESVNEKLGKVLDVDGNVKVDNHSERDSVEIEVYVSLRMGLASSKGSSKAQIKIETDEEKKFAADEYDVSLNLRFMGNNSNQLYKRVEDRRTEMLELMKNMDIPESDVEQSSVNLQKNWGYKNGSDVLLGYQASQNFVVKLNSKMKTAALVDALSSVEDVEIRHVEAKLKKLDSLQAIVLKETSTKAMNEALAFAEGFHGKLGKVMYVGDGTDISGAKPRKSFYLNKARGKVLFDAVGSNLSGIVDSVTVHARVMLIVEMK